MTLTDTTLAEIEAAARAATEPGDWSADENIIWSNGRGVPVADVRIGTPVWYKGPALPYEANARFITLACNNAAAMVQEIRALREALAEIAKCEKYVSEADTSYEYEMRQFELSRLIKTRATQKGTSDV